MKNAFNSASWLLILEKKSRKTIGRVIEIIKSYLSKKKILLQAEDVAKEVEINSACKVGRCHNPNRNGQKRVCTKEQAQSRSAYNCEMAEIYHKLLGNIIRPKNKIKYRGIWLDPKLTFFSELINESMENNQRIVKTKSLKA